MICGDGARVPEGVIELRRRSPAITNIPGYSCPYCGQHGLPTFQSAVDHCPPTAAVAGPNLLAAGPAAFSPSRAGRCAVVSAAKGALGGPSPGAAQIKGVVSQLQQGRAGDPRGRPVLPGLQPGRPSPRVAAPSPHVAHL